MGLMELAVITITDPILWWERCNWIQKNCSQWQDHTCWAGWQIGYSDIEYSVPAQEALMYYLTWGN
jgi:hypothetical protein